MLLKYFIYYYINIYVKNITCLSRGKSLVESSIFLIKYNRLFNDWLWYVKFFNKLYNYSLNIRIIVF